MKRTAYLLVLLALVSVTSGALMAGASWIGRVGITFLHKEYNFLKIWWQGAIAVFLVYLVIVYVHNFISRKLSFIPARLLHLALLILVIAALYLTHDDFTHTFSHRLLGRRFHYGAYLFWMGWAIICLFFMLQPKDALTDEDRTAVKEL